MQKQVFNFNPPDGAVTTRPIIYTQWKLKKVPRLKLMMKIPKVGGT